jgi:hypothetical protein
LPPPPIQIASDRAMVRLLSLSVTAQGTLDISGAAYDRICSLCNPDYYYLFTTTSSACVLTEKVIDESHRKALIVVISFSYASTEVLIRMPLSVHLGSGSQEFVVRNFLRPFCSVGFHLTQQLVPKFLLQRYSKLYYT